MRKTSEPDATSATGDELPLRSFEDVVRVFFDAKPGVKARSKKPAVFKRGQTENGDLEYASFSPTPATEDWRARTAVPWPTIYLSDDGPPFEPAFFVDAIAELPAVCRKGRGTHADVSLAVKEDRYVLASMHVEPPSGSHDDAAGWSVAAAAWKVEEGWAWAVMEGPVEALLPVLGLRALPARGEWTRTSGALGNW